MEISIYYYESVPSNFGSKGSSFHDYENTAGKKVNDVKLTKSRSAPLSATSYPADQVQQATIVNSQEKKISSI